MNKLFKLARAKGKWHKSPSFNLRWGAKLYKNFAQKLLAVSLCMAVVLLGVPVTTFAADTLTTLDVAVSVEGKEATIECTLTDEEDTALEGKNVTVTVEGPDGLVTVDGPGSTDGSGTVWFSATLGPAGSYMVSASFAGDDIYSGTTGSTTFKFFPITLKDEKGTAIEADSTIYRAVEVGDKLKFSAEVDSGAETNAGVTWSVNDEAIATINEETGELEVKNFGEVWVTATSKDAPWVYAGFSLDLREPVPVSGVKIFDWLGNDVTGGSATLAVSRGVDVGLSAEVSSGDAENLGVDWSSSDTSVATVSPYGSLTVNDYGTVQVTATSLDDPSKSATVTVTVAPPSTAVTGRGEPHSVALLTLMATGRTGEDEAKLKADVTWKTFIPGTTVDLELKFVMPDGEVAGQVNLMDWVATYGDMAHTDPGFVDFAPYDWCYAAAGYAETWHRFALSSFASDGSADGLLSLDWDGFFVVAVGLAQFAAARDFVLPLAVGAVVSVPGRARLAPGGGRGFRL